jgi:hypothetical protein
VREPDGVSRIHVAAGKVAGRRILEWDQCELRGELVQGVCIVHGVMAGPGPAKPGEVTADGEVRAEIAGERPDVGPRRADHGDVEVDHVADSASRLKVESMNGDRPGG